MSLPFRRRPHRWRSAHERARARASEALNAPLDATEAAWLADHLSTCRSCRGIAVAYADQHEMLRSLRGEGIDPPRDLWARTSAAIERQAGRGSRSSRGRDRRPFGRPSWMPLGALAGLLVVVVVVGASLLARRPGTTITQSSPNVALGSSVASARPGSTPIAVTADVGWVQLGHNGGVDLYLEHITKVCSTKDGAVCAPIAQATPQTLDIDQAPAAVIKSPNNRQFAVVDSQGGLSVVPAPTPSSPTPSAVPTPTPTARQSTPPASGSPSASPSIAVSPSAVAPGNAVEIVHDVTVVGESAAYSPDGAWLAFSAQPASGTQGPDIYVWRVGDPEARALTTDHRSVFSTWLGGLVLGARAVPAAALDPGPSPDPSASPDPSPSGAPASSDASASPGSPSSSPVFRAQTFLLDPANGVESVIAEAPVWRPVVDPQRQYVVYWDGGLTSDSTGNGWRGSSGRLVIGRWPASVPLTLTLQSASPEAAASIEPSASAVPSATPSATPAVGGPSDAPTGEALAVLHDGPIGDWDAHWDETGTRLAVWIADADNPSIGRLSLYVIDRQTGSPSAGPAPLAGVAALPGFSIGHDRLAWATPPGQDASGSRVKILAWTADSVGQVETAPGDGLVIVR